MLKIRQQNMLNDEKNASLQNVGKRHLFVTVKSNWCCLLLNKTRTSKVGAIPKVQKEQNIFLEKNFEFFSFGKCIVPKNVKGDPFGFINIHSVAKYQKKTRRGTLWGHFKIFLKKSHSAEKGESSVSSCLVDHVKKVNGKGGPLH